MEGQVWRRHYQHIIRGERLALWTTFQNYVTHICTLYHSRTLHNFMYGRTQRFLNDAPPLVQLFRNLQAAYLALLSDKGQLAQVLARIYKVMTPEVMRLDLLAHVSHRSATVPSFLSPASSATRRWGLQLSIPKISQLWYLNSKYNGGSMIFWWVCEMFTSTLWNLNPYFHDPPSMI